MQTEKLKERWKRLRNINVTVEQITEGNMET